MGLTSANHFPTLDSQRPAVSVAPIQESACQHLVVGKVLADLRDFEDQGRAALALEDGLLAEADVLARDPLEYRTGRPAASLASHG